MELFMGEGMSATACKFIAAAQMCADYVSVIYKVVIPKSNMVNWCIVVVGLGTISFRQ